ncbi:MAG: hypothetical protein ACTHLH_12175 [Solirubrobacterales bacterium]
MEGKEEDLPLAQMLESFRAGRNDTLATARLEEAKAMKCVLAPSLKRVAEAAERVEENPQALEEVFADLRKLVAEARTSLDIDDDDPFLTPLKTGTVELARRTHVDWEQVGKPRDES